MRDSALMAGDRLALLRRLVAEREGRAGIPDGPSTPPVPLGLEGLDRVLGGGLHRGALHEIRAATARDSGAATGFAFALLAHLAAADRRPLLFATEAQAAREGGFPHGPGLAGFGLDPGRFVLVRCRRPAEVLWVFEEALRCGGLAGVLAEVRGVPRQLDLTASRRLALRAETGGVTGFLLRQSAPAEPGASLTRWQASPLPAAPFEDFDAGIGRPAWRLILERNRHGPTASFDLEWDHGTRAFSLAPDRAAHPLPRIALPGDGPPPPAGAGAVLAFPAGEARPAGRRRQGERSAPARRAR